MYNKQKLPPSDSPRKYFDMNQACAIMNEKGWDNYTKELTTDLSLSIIKTKERISYVKKFNGSKGFMFSDEKIQEQIVLDSKGYMNHSGCSLACTFRNCQYILNQLDLYYDESSRLKIVNNNMYDECIDLDSESDIESEEVRNQSYTSTESTNVINTDSIKGKGSSYSLYDKMDDNNKNIIDIVATHGIDEAVKQMFVDPSNPNKKLTYAQMRDLYG